MATSVALHDMKWLKGALWAVGVFWALFVFFASNSPQEVGQRASGWLASPLLRELPVAVVSFASRPWVIAASFLLFGLLIGWSAHRWRINRHSLPWWEKMATDLSWMATRIESSGYMSDTTALNAELNVLGIKVRKEGLPFPTNEAGFKTFQSYLPYLRQVSELLNAREIEHARSTARELAQRPVA